jgi:RNA polymerase sigma-70 factor (ECF subfamily)
MDIMLLKNISDKELIQAYINGNELAIQQLILRFKNRIFTYISYKVRHEALAEDIFQETFIKVIETIKKGKYNEEGKFLPWAMRIAHNLIIDHYRKKSKMYFVRGNDDFNVLDILKNPENNIEESLSKEQTLSDVKALIKLLPMDQREVLMMRIYYDMSFKEISEKTNVSINTALGRMRYALINMRKIAKEKNISLLVN